MTSWHCGKFNAQSSSENWDIHYETYQTPEVFPLKKTVRELANTCTQKRIIDDVRMGTLKRGIDETKFDKLTVVKKKMFDELSIVNTKIFGE